MNRDDDIASFERYLRRRFPQRRTPVDYVSDVHQFARACDKPWRDVTMYDIDGFVDQQRQAGRSPATVKRRVAALKTFFDFLAEEHNELDWPNPVRFKRHAGKQPRPLPRDLNNADLERLWAVVDSAQDRAWFVLMWRAGLRVSEVVSLTRCDVLSPATATQPARLRVCGKGRKERVVLLSAEAYAVLAVWLAQRPSEGTTRLFVNARRQPVSVSGLEWKLRTYGQQAGVPVSPHRLRHSFARQVTEAGMPLASVGKLLGHADLGTTQRYTAGADPQVAQAYQQAMRHLASLPVTPVPSRRVTSVPPPSVGLPAQPASPGPAFEPATWTSWAPTVPEAIRQACLALVAQRWPTWKARRRRINATNILSELRRFWIWQQSRRPVVQVGDLQLADLQAYQAAQQAAGRAPRTADYTLGLVLEVAQRLADQGQPIPLSLFRLKALPRPDSLPRHLSPAESQSWEAHLRSRLNDPTALARLENACAFILAHTGLRAGECLDLQGQDLDLAQGRLWVRQGKGQRDRVVYLSPLASQALQLYLGDGPLPPSAPLLRRPTGQPLTNAWLRVHIGHLGVAAGVEHVTPHRLRHTLATQLLNAGMDITRIQKLLGHEHLNTTLIYARVHDATLEADYRQAMRLVERLHQPLSSMPEPVSDWPAKPKVPVDNSV